MVIPFVIGRELEVEGMVDPILVEPKSLWSPVSLPRIRIYMTKLFRSIGEVFEICTRFF